MTNFIKRTLSSIAFVGIMLAALLLNKFLFGAVMAFALVVMMKEFLRMTCGNNETGVAKWPRPLYFVQTLTRRRAWCSRLVPQVVAMISGTM